ncbi:MAG: hypothetical protein RJA70_4894, partial [Pseudomonadota bacterium]
MVLALAQSPSSHLSKFTSFSVSLLVLTSSCGSVTPPHVPGSVAITKEADVSCRALGEVSGESDSGLFSGPRERMQSARDVLRYNAHTLGADTVVVDMAGADDSGVALTGRAYRCDSGLQKEPLQKNKDQEDLTVAAAPERAVVEERVVDDKPASSALGFLVADRAAGERRDERPAVTKPEVSDPSLPQGSAGFTFGDAWNAAAKLCVATDNTWTMRRSESRCSGLPVSLGQPGEAELQFCDDKLCRVIVHLRPAASDIRGTLSGLLRRIEH